MEPDLPASGDLDEDAVPAEDPLERLYPEDPDECDPPPEELLELAEFDEWLPLEPPLYPLFEPPLCPPPELALEAPL